MFDVAVDGHAKERILVVEINIKPKSEPYIQVICLCLNLSDGESLAIFVLSSAGYWICRLWIGMIDVLRTSPMPK